MSVGLNEIEKQIDVTRMLISLLPVANRDTLWALLQFLYKAAEHSTDALDENGQTVSKICRECRDNKCRKQEKKHKMSGKLDSKSSILWTPLHCK